MINPAEKFNNFALKTQFKIVFFFMLISMLAGLVYFYLAHLDIETGQGLTALIIGVVLILISLVLVKLLFSNYGDLVYGLQFLNKNYQETIQQTAASFELVTESNSQIKKGIKDCHDEFVELEELKEEGSENLEDVISSFNLLLKILQKNLDSNEESQDENKQINEKLDSCSRQAGDIKTAFKQGNQEFDEIEQGLKTIINHIEKLQETTENINENGNTFKQFMTDNLNKLTENKQENKKYQELLQQLIDDFTDIKGEEEKTDINYLAELIKQLYQKSSGILEKSQKLQYKMEEIEALNQQGENIYGETAGSVENLAENIKQLQEYATASDKLSRQINDLVISTAIEAPEIINQEESFGQVVLENISHLAELARKSDNSSHHLDKIIVEIKENNENLQNVFAEEKEDNQQNSLRGFFKQLQQKNNELQSAWEEINEKNEIQNNKLQTSHELLVNFKERLNEKNKGLQANIATLIQLNDKIKKIPASQDTIEKMEEAVGLVGDRLATLAEIDGQQVTDTCAQGGQLMARQQEQTDKLAANISDIQETLANRESKLKDNILSVEKVYQGLEKNRKLVKESSQQLKNFNEISQSLQDRLQELEEKSIELERTLKADAEINSQIDNLSDAISNLRQKMDKKAS